MREPWKYQKPIIERSVRRKFTMVEAACGTGKSLMASQTALGKGKTTLIITPKNVVDDFKAELIADGVDEKDIWVYDALESHKKGYYEALEAFLGGVKNNAEEKTDEVQITF